MSETQRTGFSLAEIEQAAVSALMQWPKECFPILEASKIQVEHFHVPANRILFDCVSNHWREGKPIELVSFTSTLRELGILESVGGAYYVTQTWCNTCYSPTVFSYYLDLLIEAHAKRSVVKIARERTNEANTPGTDGVELVRDTISELSAIPLLADHNVPIELSQAALEKLSRIEEGKADLDVVPTGIVKLDQESPLRNGDLALIVGERKAGKSILALSIVSNIARRGIPILYFSLEDRTPKILDRLFAAVSRVPMHNHNIAKLSEAEIGKLQHASSEIGSWKLLIRDDVYDLPLLIAVAREESARNKIGLLVVDYAQLVRAPSNRKDQTREQEVALVSRQLRLLAMETGVPIILLSQLNTDGATRESRALEQDGTACWHISTEEDEPEIRWVKVPWQRNGRSGITFKVTFLGEIARVENYSAPKSER
jgi:replicative DNA helicase